MALGTLTQHPLWSAAGWTMVHLAWMGAVYYLAVCAVRLVIQKWPVQLRYFCALASLWGLALLAATVAIVMFGSSDRLVIGVQSAPAAAFSTANTNPLGRQAAQIVFAVLPAVWLSGAAAMFAAFAAGAVGGKRLRCRCDFPQGSLNGACLRLGRSLGVKTSVAVGVCDRITSPILVGIVRPVILLPPSALMNWRPADLEFVLLHELAHVRRWDNLFHLVERVIESVLFFHPAVWRISEWVRSEREMCCDELVVSRTGQPFDYAQLLVALAREGSPGVGMSFGRRGVAARIRYLLTQEDPTMRLSDHAAGWTLASLTALMGLLMWMSGGAHGQVNDEPVVVRASSAPASPSDLPTTRQPAAKTIPVLNGPKGDRSSDGRSGKARTDEKTDSNALILTQRPQTEGAEAAIVQGQRGWGPEQATGEPNTLQAGDISTAWASQTPDAQREWLIVHYEKAVQPKALVIHETYNPGAVDKITTFDADGKEIELWSGVDPTPRDSDKGVSIIPIKSKSKINKIKIYIDSVGVPGWNEIDAVGLRDREDQTQWAMRAESSTTYAMTIPVSPLVVTQDQMRRFLKLEQEVEKLKKELAKMKRLEEEVQMLKELIRAKK